MNIPPSLAAKRGQSYGVQHLLTARDATLTEILEEFLDIATDRTQFLLDIGAIYLNGNRLAPTLDKIGIKKGDYLRVHQNPRCFPTHVLNLESVVLFENSDFWLVNKPSGLPVHPTVDNTQENLIHQLKKHFKQDFLITHRLDVGTQGLLILAKNKLVQKEINQLLTQGQIQKNYRAVVQGFPVPLGLMTHYMEPSPRAPKHVSEEKNSGWAECRLRILSSHKLSSELNSPLSEVQIELITGRTHQIRAQLSSRGFPIMGDLSYGSTIKIAEYEAHCLQAFDLSFEWKKEGRLSFSLPNPFEKTLFPSISENFFS